MNLSSAIAELVSAVAGTQTATDLNIANFTKAAKQGYCVDTKGDRFTILWGPLQTYTSEAAMQGYCVSYCGQHMPTAFRGLETYKVFTQFQCGCVLDAPTGSGAAPFKYTPPLEDHTYYPGTGAIVDTKPFGNPLAEGYCYTWDGTNTGTASPTGTLSPTAAPVATSDFTSLGQGDCRDSGDDIYSQVQSPLLPFVSSSASFSSCVGWCGQHVDSKFVGLEVFTGTTGKFRCDCLFSLPGSQPPYSYSPEAADWDSRSGSGPIVKAVPLITGFMCYKFNKYTATTPAPTTAQTNAPMANGLFALVGTEGWCASSAGDSYTTVYSPDMGNYTNVVAAQLTCEKYCSQNLLPNFVGFETASNTVPTNPNRLYCNCLFSFRTDLDDDDAAFPLTYTPPRDSMSFEIGDGPIAKAVPSAKFPSVRCYSYVSYVSNSPTTMHPTKSPVITSIGDYTFKGSGYCNSAANKLYTYYESPPMGNYTTVADAESKCTEYCGQNLVNQYVGMETYRDNGGHLTCNCLFSYINPYDDDDNPSSLTLSYTPPPDDRYFESGVGPVSTIKPPFVPNPTYRCYSYTSYVSNAPSKSPAIVIPDFTFMGSGYCVDPVDLPYTYAYSPDMGPYTSDSHAEATCNAYCSQNRVSNFVGFESYNSNRNPGRLYCNCLFSYTNPGIVDDDVALPLTYNPPKDGTEFNTGHGPVMKSKLDILTNPSYKCYRLTAFVSNAPSKVPTKAPVATTKAPVATTNAPVSTTKAPVGTTKAPVATTKAPVATTKAPVSTPKTPAPTGTKSSKQTKSKSAAKSAKRVLMS